MSESGESECLSPGSILRSYNKGGSCFLGLLEPWHSKS